MLNPSEHEISTAHKNQNAENFSLKKLEVIWETTANLGETLTQSCAEKCDGVFALYRMKFDLLLRKL